MAEALQSMRQEHLLTVMLTISLVATKNIENQAWNRHIYVKLATRILL